VESFHEPLKLKLVNKGGMWESARSSEIAKKSDDAYSRHTDEGQRVGSLVYNK